VLRPLAGPATLLLAAMPACHAAVPPARPAPAPRMELNLSGNETAGHVLDKDYVLPTERTLRYFASKGFTVFRLPMNWDRLQPQANGPLDEAKLKELDALLARGDALHLRFIPDLHEYGRKAGHPLGSKELPTQALAGFWKPFAARYKGRFAGYDLMNEPHDMPSPQAWPQAAQQAVDAIRAVDRATPIYVEGDDWSSAGRWRQANGTLDIRDPAHRLIYSAHVYFDANTSGKYADGFDKNGVPVDIGVQRIAPFVGWLREHGHTGHIGEFGVPKSDPKWLPVLNTFLNAVAKDGDVLTGWAYWTGGDWLDNYDLSVQPAKGNKWVDRPQLAVITKKR
jgi:endoglucanase